VVGVSVFFFCCLLRCEPRRSRKDSIPVDLTSRLGTGSAGNGLHQEPVAARCREVASGASNGTTRDDTSPGRDGVSGGAK